MKRVINIDYFGFISSIGSIGSIDSIDLQMNLTNIKLIEYFLVPKSSNQTNIFNGLNQSKRF